MFIFLTLNSFFFVWKCELMLYVCFLLIFVVIVAYYRFYAFPPQMFLFELHFKGDNRKHVCTLFESMCTYSVLIPKSTAL